MEWTDEGVVLSVRRHGETAAVAELFTRANGRHMGLVHGGRSRKMRPVLQIGNHVDASWRARIADQLGHYQLELRRGYAAKAMENAARLLALTSMCELLRLLPERDPHPHLYEITLFVLGFIDDDEVWPTLLVRWELALLEELGFGLDLKTCAATGSDEDLVYVSPKSGRAVSGAAGEPYKDRLLRLPMFLVSGLGSKSEAGADCASNPGSHSRSERVVHEQDVKAGLALTGHFLETRVFYPRDQRLPAPRIRLVSEVSRLHKSTT